MNIGGHTPEKLKAVMEKQKLTWRSFTDPDPQGANSIISHWNFSATPTLYVIDAQGIIRNKWLGAPGSKVIDAAIEKLVKEAKPKGGGD